MSTGGVGDGGAGAVAPCALDVLARVKLRAEPAM